jgi:hemin uptake protein HemP
MLPHPGLVLDRGWAKFGVAMGEIKNPLRDSKKPSADELPPILSARDLLGGRREIRIEHAGEMYRLRLTRRNKLILQK